MCPSLLRQMPLLGGFRLGNVLSLVFVLQKFHFVIYPIFLDSFYPWFSFAGASATLRKTFQSADCLRQLCPNYNPRVRELQVSTPSVYFTLVSILPKVAQASTCDTNDVETKCSGK